MKNQKPLIVTATKNGVWWEIAIPGCEENVRTKRVGHVESLARQAVLEACGSGLEATEITVNYQLPNALAGVGQEWEAAAEAAGRAAMARTEAARRRKAVVDDLRAAGYTVEEVAKTLGISKQRVSQLTKPYGRSPATDI